MIRPTLGLLTCSISCLALLSPAIASASQEPAAPAPAQDPAAAAAPAAAPSPAPAAAAPVAAAATSMVDPKRFRLQLSTDVLGVTYVNPVEDGTFATERPNTTYFGLGAGRAGFRYQATPLSVVGFGFGYLLNEQLIVGADLFLGGATASVKGEQDINVGGNTVFYEYKTRTSAFGGGLSPYIHYIFTTEGALRPYAQFRFGFGAVRSWTYSEDDAPGNPTSTQLITEAVTPTVGLAGGVHLFLSDTVSLDVGLSLDYLAPYGRAVSTTVESTATGKVVTKFNADYEKASNSLAFGIPLGISIWM